MSDETRLRIDRARRAELAYDEFVKPALASIDQAYVERMKEIVGAEPWQTDKLTALVMAQRVVDAVAAQLKAVIIDGDMARKDLIRIETITSMPAARRRALGI